MGKTIGEELDQESEHALILEEAYSLGYHKVKNGCLVEPLKRLDELISQEVLKGQIKEVKDMYSWAGDNFIARNKLKLRLSELKDLLKKEEL